jgi:sigma-54 dependent transcriptional regulator, acetoin dehydrogenase operon transcriptional activator AcoR
MQEGPLDRKSITLVAGSVNTRREIENQLAEYLEGEAVVRGFSMESGIDEALICAIRDGAGGIILLSSSIVRDELLEAGAPISEAVTITAGRTVNSDHLDLVVALPPGTRALFVNDCAQTARECIEALQALGLDSVDYLPYYPGCPLPDSSIRVAITPGETAFVPKGIPQVIDLGARVLDFATLAELLGRLGIFERKVGQFSRRYLAKIISVARRLARSNEETRRLNEHLSGVLDSLSRGILVYDSEGRVSVCNENLKDLLNLRARDLVGANLAGVIRNRELFDFLECRKGDETGVFRLPDVDLIVRRFEMDGGANTVATFRDQREAAEKDARMEREYRRQGYIAKYAMGDIIGTSPAILRAKRIAGRLAATDLTILINGETGTGKELFASAIHAASGRREGPFLAVDLGALSDELIESELFGYEDGAFTGARKGGKPGFFELADGGTIFLDEIGHISAKVQNRLLRVLQEKEVLRVGGSTIKSVDVRVIAAANENLLEVVRSGGFREDLYFRLKTGFLRIPPLRERMSDIPSLIEFFMRSAREEGVIVAPELLIAFGDYAWPGNIRELQNLITYMLAVRDGPRISLSDLPDEGFFEGIARPGGAASQFCPDSELGSEDRFILDGVAALESRGQAAGRNALAELAAERGHPLSPAKARAVIERLVRLGLLSSSRGRPGTRLSEAGRKALVNG